MQNVWRDHHSAEVALPLATWTPAIANVARRLESLALERLLSVTLSTTHTP